MKLAWPRARYWIPIVVIAVGLLWWFGRGTRAPQPTLVEVSLGRIEPQVSATGRIAAREMISVGAEVSGKIAEIYADFNADVSAGQLIARIDPSALNARLAEATARLQAAEANAAATHAAIGEAEAAANDAAIKLHRAEQVHARQLLSDTDLDSARATEQQARARLTSAQAQARAADAQVAQQGAALSSAKVDLAHTEIRAPVAGTVINRLVNIGQTVTAGFQTPELFTIARDLSDIQIEVDVDEADVGHLREGQSASFTVDAFPGERFQGQVRQIRRNATTLQNVVTYTVVLAASNPDRRLFPGMTANVDIALDASAEGWKIPLQAAALEPPASVRWLPDGSLDNTVASLRAAGVPNSAIDTLSQRLRRAMMGGMNNGNGPRATMAAALVTLRPQFDAPVQTQIDLLRARLGEAVDGTVRYFVVDDKTGVITARAAPVLAQDANFAVIAREQLPAEARIVGGFRVGKAP